METEATKLPSPLSSPSTIACDSEGIKSWKSPWPPQLLLLLICPPIILFNHHPLICLRPSRSFWLPPPCLLQMNSNNLWQHSWPNIHPMPTTTKAPTTPLLPPSSLLNLIKELKRTSLMLTSYMPLWFLSTLPNFTEPDPCPILVSAITVNKRDTIWPTAFGPVPSFATTAKKSDMFEWTVGNFEETFKFITWNIIIAQSATSLDISQLTVLPFFCSTTSVWKSGPVRSFALKGLRPGLRPVYQIWKSTKNQTKPR